MPLMGHYRIALFYPIKSYQAPQVRLLSPPLFVPGIVFDTYEDRGRILSMPGIVFDTQEGWGCQLKIVKVISGC